MTELERYQQPASLAERAPTKLDQWVLIVRDVSTLASQIADTPFVPESMRGNPAAVVAAILTGREAGVGPMTSLQHIHIVKGKPGQSGQLMRQLVLSAGHSIRYVETNDTRCVVEGRRRGEDRWERVTFTADQARRAKINLGDYPEDKLVARATVRLCRRLFADCIGGMPYTVEELADGDVPTMDAQAEPGTAKPPAAPSGKRTAKRRTPAKAAAERADSVTEPDQSTAVLTQSWGNEGTGPPLPGEDGYENTGGPAPDAAQQTSNEVTRAQLNKLHTQLGEFGVDQRADKLTTVALLVKRPDLASSTDLTRTEASSVIDLLERLAQQDNPAQALDAVLASFEEADQQETNK